MTAHWPYFLDVKVFPGPWNHGLFVSFPDFDDEEYQVRFKCLDPTMSWS